MGAMAAHKRSAIRKEQILKAAEKVFARKGFQGATISDVAGEAGVSDATIYEYFSSKEELLFSIPGETARRGRDNLEAQLKYVRGAVNKIRSIIYHYLWFYESHPDYASVAMLILKQNRKFLETEAYRTVQEMSRIILQVLEEGVSRGEFRPDMDLYLVRSVILGTIEHLVIRRVLLGKPENLVELVDPLTDLVMGGIGLEKTGESWNLKITLEPADPPAPAEGGSRRKKKTR
jgi:TetR/AcrR family fatty acid metabolism transcriptional regulator